LRTWGRSDGRRQQRREFDLVQARLRTARPELARLAHELDDSLAIEMATAELDSASLAERVAKLREAASEQRQAFEDERTLLQRDAAVLGEPPTITELSVFVAQVRPAR
jgi:hypothetical protein